MAAKVCYLLTSPEKFQQMPGNGFSSTDSPGAIGKTVAAILRPNNDLSSELSQKETCNSASVDMLEMPRTIIESGTSGETATNIAMCCNPNNQDVGWSLWKTLFQQLK